MPLVFGGLVALGYLFYLDAGLQVIGYLPQYIAPYEFNNLSLRPIFMWLVGWFTEDPFPYVKSLSVLFFLLVMVYGVRQLYTSPQQRLRWGIGLIALYLMVVSPSVFQWYLLWLLALVTLTPSWLTPAWLYWSWSVNLGYLQTLPMFTDASYRVQIVEYAPIFLWIIGYWWLRRSGQQMSRLEGMSDASL